MDNICDLRKARRLGTGKLQRKHSIEDWSSINIADQNSPAAGQGGHRRFLLVANRRSSKTSALALLCPAKNPFLAPEKEASPLREHPFA